MINFLNSLLASILASIIVLVVNRQRLPKLSIETNNSANVIRSYKEQEKWKFVGVGIVNSKMPLWLRLLMRREAAENCRAMVTIFNEANESLFSMSGRWVNTPELSYLSPSERAVRVLYPDPVTITAGSKQILDIIAMKDGEIEAYGWNNEAYGNNGKTPKYKLLKGTYKVKIDVATQNGVSSVKTAILKVGNSIETTFFK